MMCAFSRTVLELRQCGDETGGMMLCESRGDEMCLLFDPEHTWLGLGLGWESLATSYFKRVLSTGNH